MDAASKTLDDYLLQFARDLSRSIGGQGEDNIFPRFLYAPGQNPPPNGFVAGGQHIKLVVPPPISLQWAATAQKLVTRPFIVGRPAIQKAFEDTFGHRPPRTNDFAANTDAVKGKGWLICGADTILTIGGKFAMLHRDSEAPSFPNSFCSPGGVLGVTPRTNAVRELNEELGIVIKHGARNLCLLYNDGGITGVTPQEKQMRVEIMLDRMRIRYGENAPKQVEILEVPLLPDASLDLPQSTLSITADIGGRAVTATAEGAVLHKEEGNSIIFLATRKLPDVIEIPGTRDRIDVRNLAEGKTLFMADTEKFVPGIPVDRTGRDVYLLSPEEAHYAALRKAAVMDNQESAFLAGLPLDTARAPNISRWTPEGTIYRRLVTNPEFGQPRKGGPYILERVAGADPGPAAVPATHS